MPFPYPQDTNSTLPTRLLSFYRSYIPRRNGCPESSRVLTILQILKHFSARLRKAKVNSAAEARREICNSDFSDRFLLCPYFHVTLSLSLSLSLCLILVLILTLLRFLPRLRCSFFFPEFMERVSSTRELFIHNLPRISATGESRTPRYIIGQHLRPIDQFKKCPTNELILILFQIRLSIYSYILFVSQLEDFIFRARLFLNGKWILKNSSCIVEPPVTCRNTPCTEMLGLPERALAFLATCLHVHVCMFLLVCVCVSPPSRERWCGRVDEGWRAGGGVRAAGETQIESGTETRPRGPLGSTNEERSWSSRRVRKGRVYSWGDKHKGDWEGMSERAGIRGGPSYIDFCPRHPRRASAAPASHPTQSSQEAAPSGAGVGVGHRRDSVREIGTEGKEQNAV